jgi:hypothetical protein
MKTLDFNKPITSKELKENIVKQFGANVNLEKYDREQLEDMRNKLRTRVFQQEGANGFNNLLQNEAYQKDKAMLELLNTRIKEMLGEQMQKLRDRMDQLSEAKKGTRPPKTKIAAKGSKPDFLDMDKDGDKKEPMKKAVADKKGGKPQKGVNPFAKKDTKVKEGKAHPKSCKCDECSMTEEPNEGNAFGKAVRAAKADGVQKGEKVKVGGKEYPVKEGFPTVDDAKKAAAGTASMKPGEKKKSSTGGEITKTATGLKHTAGKNYGGQDAPKTPDSDKKAKKSMKESQFKHNVKFVNESLQFLLNEDEEGKAKAITAAGDMVNDFTSWMQRVGQYQTKSMIELADAIRADFGAQEAEQFKQSVGPALSQTLETLTQQRELISNAVAVLAGGAAPEEPMGMEPDMGAPMEPGMEPAGGDAMNPMPAGDEFGAADAAAGGPAAAGRAMRESREQRRARKLAESHSIMAKLAK